MRKLTVLASALLVGVASLHGAASRFDGVWSGSFHSQPAPGGSAEKVNEFRLDIAEQPHGAFTGHFEKVGSRLGRQEIQNGKRFGDRACFDVSDDDGADMRWCVTVQRDSLQGVWSG